MQSKKIIVCIGLLIGSCTGLYTAGRRGNLGAIREINTLMRKDPVSNEAKIRRLIDTSSLPNKSAWYEKLVHALEMQQARAVKKSKPVAQPVVQPIARPAVVAVRGDVAVVVVDVQYDFMQLAHVNEDGERVAGGKLAVFGTGPTYKNAVEAFVGRMRSAGINIVFTQDWHPRGHMSFANSWLDAAGEEMEPWGKAGNNVVLPDFRANPNPPSGPTCRGELESAFAGGMLDENDRPLNTQQFLLGKKLWPVHCLQDTPGAAVAIPVSSKDLSVHKGMSCIADSNSGFKDDSGALTTLHEELRELGVTKIILLGIALDVCVKATALHGIDGELGDGFVYKEDLVVNLSRGVNLSDGKDLTPPDSINTLNELYQRGVRLVWIDGLGEGIALDVSALEAEGKIKRFANMQAYIADLSNVGVQKRSAPRGLK